MPCLRIEWAVDNGATEYDFIILDHRVGLRGLLKLHTLAEAIDATAETYELIVALEMMSSNPRAEDAPKLCELLVGAHAPIFISRQHEMVLVQYTLPKEQASS